MTLKEFGRALSHFPESAEALVREWAARYDLNEERAVDAWRTDRAEAFEYQQRTMARLNGALNVV
jgi:hypothetical protein